MQTDVLDLRNFYKGRLGATVRRILAHRIRARWRRANGLVVMGIGFATPYLGWYRGEALRLGALMPARQGALGWPSSGPGHSVMVDEENLPLPDNSVDRLLAVHCLELSDQVRPLLREMWRVLAPEGRLLVVVPNRRSMWVRREATPFGHGQPFSRVQLERLLADAQFTPLDWSTALHAPPFDRPFVARWAMVFERLGSSYFPGFGGVILLEARKEVGGAIIAGAPAGLARQLKPVIAPSR